ncbi:MAG TPA: TIGR02453 family protein [Vicinamibacterales bacterium]|nr:TIGR02453 family protein [Vicinamibacterales bacterium]
MAAHFSPGLFTFLRALKRSNTREWFADNRDRYVADVEAPVLQFITDVGPRLRAISRAYVADPRRMGGSMFRIYRDTRFSPDKSPFKTWVAARFAHEARRRVDGVPGFYLHLEPKDSYGGGGVYHLETSALTRIRQHIVAQPKQWAAVLASGVEIEGDRLKRAPAGFDPAHRFVEDLKRKDLYSLAEFREADVVSADFLERYVAACERIAPLMEFLTKALALRW